MLKKIVGTVFLTAAVSSVGLSSTAATLSTPTPASSDGATCASLTSNLLSTAASAVASLTGAPKVPLAGATAHDVGLPAGPNPAAAVGYLIKIGQEVFALDTTVENSSSAATCLPNTLISTTPALPGAAPNACLAPTQAVVSAVLDALKALQSPAVPTATPGLTGAIKAVTSVQTAVVALVTGKCLPAVPTGVAVGGLSTVK